jgi:hypothetical protein
MDSSDRAWVQHKSRLVMESTIANLQRAKGMPYAVPSRSGDRNGAFVVVGAGPSLAETGPHLASLQSHGAVICTVNTALKAVARYVEPDVVLVREVVDVSSHLDAPAGLRVLDIGASERVWEKAIAAGPCAFFVPGQQQTLELAASLDARPLYGGTAALTALVALVESWGAREIVLVGVDLALGVDGSVYTEGSAFGGMKAVDGPDGVVAYGGDGFAAKQAQHECGGVAGPIATEVPIPVPAWGGGTVRTIAAWADQIPWLATFAARYGTKRPGDGRVGLVDCTGPTGARKAGWFEAPIDAFTRHHCSRANAIPTLPLRMLDDGAVDRALDDIRGQADAVRMLAATVLDPDGVVVAVPGYLDGSDIVDALAARDLLAGNESGASVAAKIRYSYGTAFPVAAMAAADRATSPASAVDVRGSTHESE